MTKKNNKNKHFKNNSILIISILLAAILTSISFAIPDTLTLQGKLANSTGNPQSGTYNFSFKIYDTYESGTKLYESNKNITTDSNGVYDVILQGLGSLNFSSQYYLGITIGTDDESVPRINLTSSPYSFRANISSNLETDGNYEILVLNITGNLSVGGTSDDTLTIITNNINITQGNIETTGNLTLGRKIIFGLGQIIDNVVNGLIKIDGNLNVTGNTTIGNTLFVDNTSGNVGIGTFAPNDALEVIGNVRISGSLNATNLNISGNTVIRSTGSITMPNNIGLEMIDASGSRQNVLYIDSGDDLNFGNTNYDDVLINVGGVSNAVVIKEISGNVGIGTTTPNEKLVVIGSANISDSLNVSGTIQATNLVVDSVALGWTNLTTYPSACGPGEFVTAVGDTLTCLTPGTTSSAAAGWTNNSDDTITSLNVIVGGTDFVINTSTNKVGIGTATPNDEFEVTGNARISGSLNATSINSSKLTINNTLFMNDSRVGIGTSSPTAVLDITTTSQEVARLSSTTHAELALVAGASTNPYIVFKQDASRRAEIGYSNSGHLYIGAAQTTDGAINIIPTTNNIGIGTTTPATTLDVKGKTNITGNFSVGETNNILFVDNTSERVGIGTSSPTATFQVVGDLLMGSTTESVNIFDSGSSVSLAGYDGSGFNPLDIRATGPTQLFLNTDGNIGIGTTTPATTLDVQGKTNFTGNFSVGETNNILFVDNTSGRVGIGTSSPTANLHIYENSVQSGITVGSGTSGDALLVLDASNGDGAGSDYWLMKHERDDNTFQLGYGGVDSDLTIDSSGNIGIGTTTPLNTLHVNGSGAQGGLRITNESGQNVFFVNSTNGKVGVGGTSHDGIFGVSSGSAGSVTAHEDADSIVIEQTTTTGMSILTQDVSSSIIYFGSASSNQGAQLNWNYNADNFVVGTLKTGASTALRADASIVNLILSGASGSEIAEFKGKVGIGTATPNERLVVEGSLNATGNVSLGTAETFFVDNTSGKVGIGTSSPGSQVEISGAGPTLEITNTGSGSNALHIDVGETTGNQFIFPDTNTYLIFQNSAREGLVTIEQDTSNIGIGTTTPATNLDVKGKANFTGNFSVGETNNILFVDNTSGRVGIGTSSPTSKFEVTGAINIPSSAEGNPTGGSSLNLRYNTASDYANIRSRDWDGGTWETVQFEASDYIFFTNTGTQDFTIDSSGMIGIGTTTPTTTLDVKGKANFTGNFSVGETNNTFFVDNTSGNIGIGTSDPNAKLTFAQDTTPAGGISFGSDVNLYRQDSITLRTDDNFQVDGGQINVNQWQASSGATLNIHSDITKFYALNANVGIGTAAPGAKLEVVGNLSINGSIDITDTNGSLYQPVYGSDDGLVLYLPFSENLVNISNKTYDRSPYGNDGTLEDMNNGNSSQNGTWTQGKYGYAMNFNGLDDTINISNDPSLDITNSITIEAWIKYQDVSIDARIIAKRSTTDGYAIRIGNADDKLLFTLNGVDVSKSNSAIPFDEWTHITATYDGNFSKIYINGIEENKSTYTDPIAINTRDLIIGNHGTLARHFKGSIDEVRIYSRALASEEIRTHYLRGSGFGASGAITADKFRIVNTSGSNVMEMNGSGLTVTGAVTATSFIGNGSSLTGITTGFINDSDINVTNFVANNTLFVNGSRVGIGTSSPSHTLTIAGGDLNLETNGNIRIGGSIVVGIQNDDTRINTEGQDIIMTNGGSATNMIIKSSGNVGIGAIAPNAKLQINGSGNLLNITNGTTQSFLTVDGDTGFVGIGTDNPSNIFHVFESSGSIEPQFESDTASIRIGIDKGAAAQDSVVEFKTAGTTNWRVGTDSNANLNTDFIVEQTNNQVTPEFIIKTSGNIGIGTTSPLNTLHVNGSGAEGGFRITNESGLDVFYVNASSGYIGFGTSNPTDIIDIDNNGMDRFTLSGAGILTITANTGGTPLVISNSDGGGNLMSIETDKFLVDGSGNVGIGTAKPGQKLHVEGSVNVSTTLNAPVINTTRDDQNITINSGGGSIIIRLG